MIGREEAEIGIEMVEEIGSGINQDPDREAVKRNVAEVEAKVEVVETGAGIAEALIGIDRRKERGPGQEKEKEGTTDVEPDKGVGAVTIGALEAIVSLDALLVGQV